MCIIHAVSPKLISKNFTGVTLNLFMVDSRINSLKKTETLVSSTMEACRSLLHGKEGLHMLTGL